MSSPPNRLAAYRSYSFYHVLAICDSTATGSALAHSANLDVWKHPDTKTLPSGRYSPKLINPKDPEGGQYCILINGSTDAAYVVDSVNFSSTTGGAATPEGRYTSIAVEGTLNVSEPKGIVFLDQIIKCCINLGVDSANSVYVLKTFFTGFGYDATVGDFVDTITDIAPLMFTVTNVVGSFTVSGGIYNIEFVSCVDGTARLPQYSKAGNSIPIEAQKTLRATLKAFEQSINSNYLFYYNCVIKQVEQAFKDANVSSPATKVLSKVNYVIDLSSDYDDKDYVMGGEPAQIQTVPGCDAPPQILIPAHSSIEDGISSIMNRCIRVKKDMSDGDAANKIKYEFRVRAAVSSTLLRPETINGVKSKIKQFEYTVHYIIERFMVPKDAVKQTAFPGTAVAANVINFDYIYTGKNIDIIDFDMKVNYGLAYLQTATTANSYRGQLEKTQSRSSYTSQLDLTQLARTGEIRSMPVYFGSQVKAPTAKNTNAPSHSVQSTYTLSKHASIEMTEATVKIVGNPSLLNSVTLTSSPERLVKQAGLPPTEPAQPSTTYANFKDWSYVPAFIKIKIKMPRNNDDISAFTGMVTDTQANTGNLDYAQDFWFDGFYYVISIDHSFDAGIFTQTLHILGITPPDAIAALTDTTNDASTDLTQPINDCFDSILPCDPQPSAGSTATAPPAATASTKTTKDSLQKMKPCPDKDQQKQETNKVNCIPPLVATPPAVATSTATSTTTKSRATPSGAR